MNKLTRTRLWSFGRSTTQRRHKGCFTNGIYKAFSYRGFGTLNGNHMNLSGNHHNYQNAKVNTSGISGGKSSYLLTQKRYYGESMIEKEMKGGMEEVLITNEAVSRIKVIQDKHQKPVMLRVGIESGGCSGMSYTFKLDENYNPEADRVFEKDGQKLVVVDKDFLDLLTGSILDYKNELIRTAFVISSNPNAGQKCSCGTSFNPK
eukprot:TRINITY_DN3447_c0_g1_i1.p1 TRINITY_DN3447_c0_g1~~TRINITY_DN3447_c0_g1_i1.p1  ORF type:complete len:205 (+),score=38.25 TRINITY_DN3447_c0_g1_i1:16-630(+)